MIVFAGNIINHGNRSFSSPVLKCAQFFGRCLGKVSFGGSKGRRLKRGEWDLPEFRLLRDFRSPGESLMYTLKRTHGLGRMRRTGLPCVRAEMLEKAVACNFGRALLLREREARRREEERRKAEGARKSS